MSRVSGLKRKRSSDVRRPRKRHVTPRRLSNLYQKTEEEINELSQTYQGNIQTMFGKEISPKEALVQLQDSDLDVNAAVEKFMTQLEERDQEREEESLGFDVGGDDEKEPEVEDDNLDETMELPPIRDDDSGEENGEEELKDKFTKDFHTKPYQDRIAGLSHRLHITFSNEAQMVFKNCVGVVAKIQDKSAGIVVKVNQKEKKLKFYCRSEGGQTDVLEFVFENDKSPRPFVNWELWYDQENETSDFTLSVKLDDIWKVAKKINKNYRVYVEITNSQVQKNACLVFKLRSRKDDLEFKTRIRSHNISIADPHLSQFRSLPESQDRSFSLLSAPVERDYSAIEALVTLYIMSTQFKAAYDMFSGISNVLLFCIKRIHKEDSEIQLEDQFEIIVKAKDKTMKSHAKLPIRGGPRQKSLVVRGEIKSNITLRLPCALIGKILKFGFIAKSIKIDIHAPEAECTTVRLIFRFQPQKAQGSLYYNISLESARDTNIDMFSQEVLSQEIEHSLLQPPESSSGRDGFDFGDDLFSLEDNDMNHSPLQLSAQPKEPASKKKKSPASKKKKSPKKRLSGVCITDAVFSDDD